MSACSGAGGGGGDGSSAQIANTIHSTKLLHVLLLTKIHPYVTHPLHGLSLARTTTLHYPSWQCSSTFDA
ncbi:unnamed protein product [Onchocerca flexuosa]|uniref:Uncharacterized protein n=1 Tax=Onchocerca flexuosa TaxID=387005 RepID=A0A183HDU9_9BILA|nr:unnamed protein product [Onchocerca flexuosa]